MIPNRAMRALFQPGIPSEVGVLDDVEVAKGPALLISGPRSLLSLFLENLPKALARPRPRPKGHAVKDAAKVTWAWVHPDSERTGNTGPPGR